MVRKHFRSGMDFVMAQASPTNRDWINYLQNSTAPGLRRPSSPTITSTSTFSFTPIPILSSDIRTPSPTASSFRALPSAPSTTLSPSTSDASYDDEPKTWRFWSWVPPIGEQQQQNGQDAGYETQVAHYKDYLRRSETHVYSISGLKVNSILEYSPMMDYVALYECGDCENNKENFAKHIINSVRSYFIFKEGVRPLWEDEYNVAGGCWIMKLNSTYNGVICPKDLWKLLMKALTDEQMKPYLNDEICGVGLTIRRRRKRFDKKDKKWHPLAQEIIYKLTVWNKDSNKTIAIFMIGQLLKSLSTHLTIDRLQYTSHSSTIHQNAVKQQQRNNKRKLDATVANDSALSSPRFFRI